MVFEKQFASFLKKKNKQKLTLKESQNSTPNFLRKVKFYAHTVLYRNVHISIIQYHSNVETLQCRNHPVSEGTHCGVYPYNGILLSNKKKLTSLACCNTDEPLKCAK